MQPFTSFHTIALHTISPRHYGNLHPFLPVDAPEALGNSMQRVGLLRPLLLLRHDSNRYRLISGARRLHFFQKIFPEQPTIPCLILAAETPAEDILTMILEDQLLSGGLSPMEEAFFFRYCLEVMTTGRAARLFLPRLGRKIQPHTITKNQGLLDLERPLQRSIHDGTIGEKTGHELRKLEEEDRLTLHGIFMTLKLGAGKQKRLLSLSKDLAAREDTNITKLLAGEELNEILNHQEMNAPQKLANLLITLHKRLHPLSEAAEEAFRKEVAQLRLPPSCSLSHGQSFETDEVSICLRLNTLAELRHKLPHLLALTGPTMDSAEGGAQE